MITPQTDKKYTVVHAFSGSGGCSSGFDEEGFETLAALDFDADACADLDYLLNRKVAVVVDIEKMEPVDMRRIVGDRRPDVYVATPPCKGWSRLLGKGRRMSDKYVRMCSLAVRSVWLALHAWDEPPPLIVIENVRGMSTEGREMMDIIKRELRAFGYLFDIRTWNVGKIGNLAQSRDRCLFVARNPKRCPAFLMVPTEHPLRPCGDELGRLPPPTLDKASKSMHKLPQLSAMNWLRIAAIPPGKDWKALPARIQLGGNPKDRADPRMNLGPNAHAGIMGVEHPGRPAHTVTGNARMQGTWGGVADPMGRAATAATPKAKRARKAPAGQAMLFGEAAATTATSEPAGPGVDLQIADRDGRQSGGFGVNAWGAPAHTVVGHTDVSNTWASTATPITFTRSWSAGRRGDRGGVDPRLDCSPRNGAYGVQDPERPSATIVGHHKHDNSPGSWADNGPGFADPRLGYRDEGDEAAGKHSGRGCYGVLDTAAPAPTIRGHMEIRQAPGAVAEPMSIDPRKEWDTSDPNSWAAKGRPHAYGVQDWERPASTIRGSQKIVNSRASVAHPGYPEPTHWLVRDEAGGLVLLGPEITDWDEICYLVIMTEDEPGVWSWHRPMTDLELAVLQSLPAEHNGAMLALRGPSGKRREHIGNMLPKAVAKAIARACRATLDQPHATFQLVGKGKIWVRQKRERAPVHAEVRA
jgi:site-specific DNA-cytosine methylase